jgi:hypothetical protein
MRGKIEVKPMRCARNRDGMIEAFDEGGRCEIGSRKSLRATKREALETKQTRLDI